MEHERNLQQVENETLEVVQEKHDRAKERYKNMKKDIEKVS